MSLPSHGSCRRQRLARLPQPEILPPLSSLGLGYGVLFLCSFFPEAAGLRLLRMRGLGGMVLGGVLGAFFGHTIVLLLSIRCWMRFSVTHQGFGLRAYGSRLLLLQVGARAARDCCYHWAACMHMMKHGVSLVDDDLKNCEVEGVSARAFQGRSSKAG